MAHKAGPKTARPLKLNIYNFANLEMFAKLLHRCPVWPHRLDSGLPIASVLAGLGSWVGQGPLQGPVHNHLETGTPCAPTTLKTLVL